MKRLFAPSLLLAVLASSCAPEFEPASELKTLRMLAVQKDKPYARPGEEVQLRLLWHDATSEPSRTIQIQWLAGCYNPAGDLFASCFADDAFGGLAGSARVTAAQIAADATAADAGAEAGAVVGPPTVDAGAGVDGGVVAPGVGLDAGTPQAGAPTLSAPFDERVLGGGDFQIKVGYGERFSFRMPSQIVSSRPRAPSDPTPEYGLAYLFVAICAGELRLDPSDAGFPLACYDGNQRLGSRDFVAGYTAVYAYADSTISNDNPSIAGLSINGRDADIDCIGAACSGLIAPASEAEGTCSDSNTLDWCADEKHCNPIAIKPVIDQSQPAENDAVLGKIRGGDFAEQMWINYYVDRGTLSRDIRLLNDAVTGWAPDYGGEYKPTQLGTAHLWAVAHDNRGGAEWVRTTVCIEE
jgi:hypothetical protein